MAQQEAIAPRLARKATMGPNGCWVWTRPVNGRGYAALKVGGKKGKMREAYTLAYEISVGPVPEGLELDHLCRNRACINPYHLEAVTRRVNSLRGQSFCADNARKTHCRLGHPLTVTIEQGRSRRRCVPCQNAAVKRYQDRKRGKKPVRSPLTCVAVARPPFLVRPG